MQILVECHPIMKSNKLSSEGLVALETQQIVVPMPTNPTLRRIPLRSDADFALDLCVRSI